MPNEERITIEPIKTESRMDDDMSIEIEKAAIAATTEAKTVKPMYA
jgi:hypothetical protein